MTQVRRIKSVNRIGGVIGRYGPNGESGVWDVHSLSSDPYYDDVVLVLHMDGANGSTAFADRSRYGHSVTALGNAQISTTHSQFGGSSLLLDGSGDYLRVTHSATMNLPANGDFTMEAWVRRTSSSGNRLIASKWNSGGTNAWLFYLTTTGSLLTNGLTTSGADIQLNTWAHVVWTRSGGVIRHFVNGALNGTATFATGMAGTSNVLIGANDNGANFWSGNIDEFRLTKNVARYTSAFSPPSRASFP